MSRPLRSAPITRASALLQAGPPARAATVLSTSPLPAAWCAPSRPAPIAGTVSARAFPCFRTQAADRARATCTPGTAWPAIRAFRQAHPGTGINAPVPMPSSTLDASAVVHSRSPSRSPPDSSRLPFPHRSPRQSSANAACGGLTPPSAGRRRRATKPSSCVQQAHRVIASYSGDSFPRTRRKMPVRNLRSSLCRISGLCCWSRSSPRSGAPPASGADGGRLRYGVRCRPAA
jgi:hypothetical protein